MRIAIVSPAFAEYSWRLAAALAHKHDVLLFLDEHVAESQLDGLDLENPARLQVARLPIRPISKLPSTLWRITRMIGSFKPDVVHFQEEPYPINPILMLAFRGRALVVLTVHDPSPHTGADKTSAERWSWALASARRLAQRIVVHGDFCRKIYESLPESKGKPVFEHDHGEILTPTEASTRAPLAGRVLFFGRMQRYKGLELLLDAADLLAADNSGLSFQIAGRGPELDRLRDRLTDRRDMIVEDGFTSPTRLIELLQEASVVVAPYLDATQSGVVAAAFGNDRPMVATKVGGLADAIDDEENGLLTPPGDAAALADALQRLAQPPEQPIFAAAAETRRKSRLNWDVIADGVAAFYEKPYPRS